MSIAELLRDATFKLKVVTDVPELESEILLAFILKVNRVYLHTHKDEEINFFCKNKYEHLISRRVQGEPIAYLIGHREFWSLDLQVTPDVLIPRPETEVLVECTLSYVKSKDAIIADLGTGTGAIALALAKERPLWMLYATDKSNSALEVAKLNARHLSIENIIFCLGDWCRALPNIKFDAIVSNPPYIAEDDAHLSQGDLRFEPQSALISKMNGLYDLHEIIKSARHFLKEDGFLLVEHGFLQAQKVQHFFKKEGYEHIKTYPDFAGCDRVTMGSWRGF